MVGEGIQRQSRNTEKQERIQRGSRKPEKLERETEEAERVGKSKSEAEGTRKIKGWGAGRDRQEGETEQDRCKGEKRKFKGNRARTDLQ